MSHEIEADFVNDWPNEATQCRHCSSFHSGDGIGFCSEAKDKVPDDGHCDFFQSVD
jgi:hypothetical protein